VIFGICQVSEMTTSEQACDFEFLYGFIKIFDINTSRRHNSSFLLKFGGDEGADFSEQHRLLEEVLIWESLLIWESHRKSEYAQRVPSQDTTSIFTSQQKTNHGYKRINKSRHTVQ
jgi:hypothetical protein